MKRFAFALFIALVVLISGSSLFVHEGIHFFECSMNGGTPALLINPKEAQDQFGLFGIGALGTACSKAYSNTSIEREAKAYFVQFLFVGVGSIVVFKRFLQ